MAVSNAFYESLFLHYQLDLLCAELHAEEGCRGSGKLGGKGMREKRGDVLEAYFAGIDMDVSREGGGSKEIRDWLFQILALRLGPQHPSSSSTSVTNPKFRKARRPGGNQNKIWWESSKADWPEELASRGLPKRRESVSEDQERLHLFREEVFEHMKLTVREIHACLPPVGPASYWGEAETQEFWEEMRRYFDAQIQLKKYITDHERMLLYYYQVLPHPFSLCSSTPKPARPSCTSTRHVFRGADDESYVYLKLDDLHSAQHILGAILLHKSSVFTSKLHKESIRRLLSIRLPCCTVEIQCDELGRAGVFSFPPHYPLLYVVSLSPCLLSRVSSLCVLQHGFYMSPFRYVRRGLMVASQFREWPVDKVEFRAGCGG